MCCVEGMIVMADILIGIDALRRHFLGQVLKEYGISLIRRTKAGDAMQEC